MIEIKRAAPDHIEQLQDISRRTFSEAFAAQNSAENMNMYLEQSFSQEKLEAELRDENAEFYFAVLDERVIGYLKLNCGASQPELKDHKALEIERIYVLKEFHGKKAGQLLFEKALEIAEQKNADYVWLGVWEENPRAIRFYRKNGFVEFGKHIFKLGHDEQKDILMKRSLRHDFQGQRPGKG